MKLPLKPGQISMETNRYLYEQRIKKMNAAGVLSELAGKRLASSHQKPESPAQAYPRNSLGSSALMQMSPTKKPDVPNMGSPVRML